MSAARHTPWPWRWSNEFQTSEGNETWSLLGSDGFGILSCDGAPNSPQNVNPHDARLIAAAPELLEQLRNAVAMLEARGARDADTDDMRAALAKANGSTA